MKIIHSDVILFNLFAAGLTEVSIADLIETRSVIEPKIEEIYIEVSWDDIQAYILSNEYCYEKEGKFFITIEGQAKILEPDFLDNLNYVIPESRRILFNQLLKRVVSKEYCRICRGSLREVDKNKSFYLLKQKPEVFYKCEDCNAWHWKLMNKIEMVSVCPNCRTVLPNKKLDLNKGEKVVICLACARVCFVQKDYKVKLGHHANQSLSWAKTPW